MKGIYCLIIEVKGDIKLKIGSLGKIWFEKGNYVYVGSSQNNLEKRVKRHLSGKKKMHWHIDYLLASPYARINHVLCKIAKKKEECKTAKLLSATEIPVKGFGCSDCKCNSHLFKIINLMNMGNFNNANGWSIWK